MPGRMESVENLVAAAVPGSRNRGWFSTLPTAPWKSLRDSHSSTAPTMTILSYHQGDTSTGLPKGTFLLGLDKRRTKVLHPSRGWEYPDRAGMAKTEIPEQRHYPTDLGWRRPRGQ